MREFLCDYLPSARRREGSVKLLGYNSNRFWLALLCRRSSKLQKYSITLSFLTPTMGTIHEQNRINRRSCSSS